ncbi:MAG TPA: group III truncated hemoglobin [Flavobacteriales bacterium]|nr:group III truncated hemoglobin [Flavobacteriales bacterium]
MSPNPHDATATLRDIESPDDVILLVDTFYRAALIDPVIGHIFVDVAKIDLESHMPRLYRFWCAILLGMPTYRENAFAPHMRLHQLHPLEPQHFERWLALFHGTIDSLFEGPTAELAKKRSRDIATAMAGKLAHLDRAQPLAAVAD